MAQGFQITNPRMRFFDSDGAPLALGKLYHYAAGTSTPLDIYSDSTLSSTHAQPAVLSASGEITIFVPSATLYKFDLYDANDVHQSGWPVDGVEAIPAPDPAAATPSPVPPGGIIAYGGTSAPSGYLMCQGALVSRSTYAALFAIVGTAYGAGDGSTTFGLPDLQQRFPMGKASSGTGATLGGTGGTIDHTHTGPSHAHTVTLSLAHTHTVTQAAHTHTVVVPRTWVGSATNAPSITTRLVVGNGVATYDQPSADQTVTSSSDGALAAVATSSTDPGSSPTTSAAGTGATGTGNPPFQTVNFIIKT